MSFDAVAHENRTIDGNPNTSSMFFRMNCFVAGSTTSTRSSSTRGIEPEYQAVRQALPKTIKGGQNVIYGNSLHRVVTEGIDHVNRWQQQQGGQGNQSELRMYPRTSHALMLMFEQHCQNI